MTLPIDIQFHAVKASSPYKGLHRPLGLQEVEAPRISRQSAHEGGKVISPMHQPPLPSRRYPWYLFLLEVESTLGPKCNQKY
jgi:hypothetical protein